jgi:hypothetical protein
VYSNPVRGPHDSAVPSPNARDDRSGTRAADIRFHVIRTCHPPERYNRRIHIPDKRISTHSPGRPGRERQRKGQVTSPASSAGRNRLRLPGRPPRPSTSPAACNSSGRWHTNRAGRLDIFRQAWIDVSYVA